MATAKQPAEAEEIKQTPRIVSIVQPWYGHEAYTRLINQVQSDSSVVVIAGGSIAGEYRVTFSTASSLPSSSSTRSSSTRHCYRDDPHRTVACVVVGQHKNQVTAVGMGNPHVRSLATAETSVLLPNTRGNEERFWWFLLSPSQLLLACGSGKSPSRESVKLVFKLTTAEAQEFSNSPTVHVGFSNWQTPVHHLRILDIASKSANTTASKGLSHATHKWYPDGTLKRFEGNTLICFLPPSSRLFACLVEAQTVLRNNPILSPFLGFLPPSSFHMTVCELHTSKSPSRFVVSNDKDTRPLSEINLEIKRRLPPEIQASSPWTIFQMHCVDISLHVLHLKPATPAQQEALATYRQIVSKAAGFDYNANYEFHITLCYILHPLVGTQLVQEVQRVRWEMRRILEREGFLLSSSGTATPCRTVEMRQPQLTFFRDMGSFLEIV